MQQIVCCITNIFVITELYMRHSKSIWPCTVLIFATDARRQRRFQLRAPAAFHQAGIQVLQHPTSCIVQRAERLRLGAWRATVHHRSKPRRQQAAAKVLRLRVLLHRPLSLEPFHFFRPVLHAAPGMLSIGTKVHPRSTQILAKIWSANSSFSLLFSSAMLGSIECSPSRCRQRKST